MEIFFSIFVRSGGMLENDYRGVIEKIALRQQGAHTILEVTWKLLDEDLQQRVQMAKITARQSVSLDLEDGVLAFGKNKNVLLTQLRDALGQNIDGQPWSFSHLEGAGPALIHVKERIADDGHKFNEVARVSSLV